MYEDKNFVAGLSIDILPNIICFLGEGKDLDITQNTCSPNCKSCEPKTKMATSEWCLLECNNAGASRCLPDWCECY